MKVEEYETSVSKAKDALYEQLVQPQALDAAAVAFFQQAMSHVSVTSTDGKLALAGPQQQLSLGDKSFIDDVLKGCGARLAREAAAEDASPMQYIAGSASEPAVPRLLDLAQLLSSSGLAQPGACFFLVEELMDVSLIDGCGDLFSFLEASLAGTGSKAVQTVVLRTCNALLRRVSKANDALLCGRVLLFLARCLPLADKSGVNQGCLFNERLPLALDDVPEGATDTNGQPIDGAFYRTFWGLQQQLAKPQLLFSAEAWNRFNADVSAVLDKFDALPISSRGSSKSSSKGSGGSSRRQGLGAAGRAATPPPSASKAAAAAAAAGAGATPRTTAGAGSSSSSSSTAPVIVGYLPSAKLLNLQLKDATLRADVLTQVLIVLHFLQNPMPIPPQQAAVWQLKPKQVPEVEALKARVLGCLAATPGDGDALAASVRAALAHEGFWTLWKAGPSAAQAGGVYSGKPDTAAERCVPFTSYKPKPEASGLHLPADQEPPAKKRRTAGPSSGGRRQVNPDAALAEVWGAAGGAMDGLRADERELGRSLQDFVAPVFYALDDAVDEGRPQASVAAGLDQVYMWRLQRQLPRHHLELFMAQQFVPGTREPLQGPAAVVERLKRMFPDQLTDNVRKQDEAAAAAAAAKAAADKAAAEKAAAEKAAAAAAAAAAKAAGQEGAAAAGDMDVEAGEASEQPGAGGSSVAPSAGPSQQPSAGGDDTEQQQGGGQGEAGDAEMGEVEGGEEQVGAAAGEGGAAAEGDGAAS